TAVDVPPRKPKRSTRSVSAPARAAATAAVDPAEPAPTTSTSTLSLICARVCTNEQGGTGRGGAAVVHPSTDAAGNRDAARRLPVQGATAARAGAGRGCDPLRDRRRRAG